MSSENKVSFSSLSQREKLNKFKLLLQSKGMCIVWMKGSEQRAQFSVYSVGKKSEKILLKNLGQSTFKEAQYCVSFFINGVSYFTHSLLKKSGVTGMYALENEAVLYKTEKRSSFRLLAYPTYKIKAFIKLPKEENSENNVIDFKTKLSKTGLFKNFLKELDSDVEKKKEDGFEHFRVQDISATGMALLVGKMEGGRVSESDVLENIIIDFQGEELIIPSGEVVYKIETTQADRNNISIFKIGIRFLRVDIQTDQFLVKKIHSVLAKVDGGVEFEEFIN